MFSLLQINKYHISIDGADGAPVAYCIIAHVAIICLPLPPDVRPCSLPQLTTITLHGFQQVRE